jgi:probable F420-dependent oxidoreductase
MHLALSTMNNLHHVRPDVLARAVEERGFESLWIGEHAHLPAAGRVPYPSQDGVIPEPYKHMADMFVSLAVAASATTRLKLGTGVALILERDVFNMAKAVASLDQLSGGRVMVGIGVGWNSEEFENVALMPWGKRYSGMKECVAALRALWGDEVSSFQGEWYNFDQVWSFPKPLQQPMPAIHVGVAGKTGTAHAAQWGDGWFPIDIGVKDFGGKLGKFHEMLRENGRDPADVPVSVVAFQDPSLDQLMRYQELGITRVVVNDSGRGWDETRQLLDSYAAMIPQLG